MDSKNTDIPFIGIVLKNGYVESYSYKAALINDFHHSFIFSSKHLSNVEYDEALRFVRLYSDDYYTLEGEPALNPFTTGKKQISTFAAYCVERGVDPSTRIRIKDHKLNTQYEGSFIGRLRDFICFLPDENIS